MFERYTESARRVLFFSRYEASQLGSPQIQCEHVLLGLLRESKGLPGRILARANIVRADVEGRVVFKEKLSTSVEIPFDPQTMRALSAAAEEADRLRHNYIGSEHLLLSLLRVEDSVAAELLIKRGLSLDSVREVIAAQPPGEPLSDDVMAYIDNARHLIQKLTATKLSPEAGGVANEILASLDRLQQLLRP